MMNWCMMRSIVVCLVMMKLLKMDGLMMLFLNVNGY